jgi:hypothetical protein
MTPKNRYRVTYKNGNVLEWNAISLEIADGNLYECNTSMNWDNPEWSVHSAKNIEKLDLIGENVK